MNIIGRFFDWLVKTFSYKGAKTILSLISSSLLITIVGYGMTVSRINSSTTKSLFITVLISTVLFCLMYGLIDLSRKHPPNKEK